MMNTHQKGFTIVELMIATTVFSIVLLVILASFFQIGRMFYKGVSVDNTQETTRSVVDDITTDLKLSSGFNPSQAFNGAKYFCVGGHRYTYKLDSKVTDPGATDDVNNPSGIIEAILPGSSCLAPNTRDGSTNKQQLLSSDMQLNALDVNCDVGSGVCNVHLHVIFYGADNNVFSSTQHPNDPARALNDPDAQCSGNLLSTQFCAASDVNSTVVLGF